MSGSAPPKGQTAAVLLLIGWLLVSYTVALRLTLDLLWPRAAWQSVACLLAAPVLVTMVVKVIGAPRKSAHVTRRIYQGIFPGLVVGQYVLPWLGWSTLLWFINGGGIARAQALSAGGVITILSYLSGLVLALALRPRAGDVDVTHLEVPIRNLPTAFDGYRILHISDAHTGTSLARAPLAERLAGLKGRLKPAVPDLVVFTGDLVARGSAVELAAADLAVIPALDGRFAVLGNHDTWIGEEWIASALTHAGFRVLANEHVAVERGGQTLYLAGVNDARFTRQDNLPAALHGIPDTAPIIALAHSPDIVLKAMAERVGLFLAGHTHGGQIIFPWIGPLYVPTRLGRRRMSGLIQVDGRLVFINRGLGEVFVPFRLNCPPEVALITLRTTAIS